MTEDSHHTGPLSPEMALLGQLHAGPGHGYDLHRKVIEDLGQVWHLSQSQAYTILKRLEQRGDICSETIVQERLPARQVLNITPQGRARFLAWLAASSGGSTRSIRLEFITRLYFLRQYFPEQLEAAFERQRLETILHIQRLQETQAGLRENALYNQMSLDLRLRQLQAVLEWLGQYHAQVSSLKHT